jgi:hypothetical protein
VTFTFQSSFWEHYKAHTAVLLRIRSQVFIFVGLGLLGLFMIVLWVHGSVTGRFDVPIGVRASGVYLVFALPITNLLSVSAVRRKNKLIDGQQTFSFSDDGVHRSGALSDVTIRWGGIHRFVETRAFLLFFTSARCAVYLPKRVLSAEDLASVRALAAAKVTNGK